MTSTSDYPERLAARTAAMPTHLTVEHYNEAIAAALVTYEAGVASLTERLQSTRQHLLANPGHTEWLHHERDLIHQLHEWQAQLAAAQGILDYLIEFDEPGSELNRQWLAANPGA